MNWTCVQAKKNAENDYCNQFERYISTSLKGGEKKAKSRNKNYSDHVTENLRTCLFW